MKRNVVFMFNVKIENSKLEGSRWSADRSDPYIYGVKSWEHWCKKNDCDLYVLDELFFPNEEMAVPWQKFYIFDLLESNGVDYDQIMYVDADTIVHPDCPNVFEMTDGKYTFVHNEVVTIGFYEVWKITQSIFSMVICLIGVIIIMLD